MNESKINAWYAIRVTYSRELRVKSILDSLGVENYIPMHWEARFYAGEKRKIWTPIIHNLIFIHTDSARLSELKKDTTLPIRYIMTPGSKNPLIIPDQQMNDFMAVVATQDEHIEVVSPESIALKSGDRVRITNGMFSGIEGTYIRHKGQSKVAVTIANIATILTAYVPLRYVEKIAEL